MLFRRDLAEILVAHRVAEGEWQSPSTSPGISVRPDPSSVSPACSEAIWPSAPGYFRDTIADNETLAQEAVVRRAVPHLHVAEKNRRHSRILPS